MDIPPNYEAATGVGGHGQPPPPVAYVPSTGPNPAQPYPPAGGPAQYGLATVVVRQPLAATAIPGSTMRFGQNPAMIICQHCQATVTTSITYKAGLLTWALCGVLACAGCILGCCLIPFCIDGTKEVQHTCPNCRKVVGNFCHLG